MPVPLADLPPVPPELVHPGEVPANTLFFDTNCALHPDVERAQQEGWHTLISAIVYAELTARAREVKRLGIIDANLSDRGLRVVLFDVTSARCFFDLCRQIRFDSPPLLRHNETERASRDRLRFDLMLFAAALRHRATLVTDNTRDFEHFPYRQYWKSRAELFP
jgi:predicted nucleic acid-binding protein